MQNVIVKGRDNPVIMTFTFTGDFEAQGLNNFSSITVDVGSETYSTANSVTIVDKHTLSLNIGSVTALADGNYNPEIVGFSATYPNGYLLNGCKKKVIDKFVTVTSC